MNLTSMSVRRVARYTLIILGLAANNLSGCVPSKPHTSLTSQRPADHYPPGLFRDVTEQAGIHFRHTNGDTGQHLFPETFGGGCAFLDYDGDGYPDILLLSCGHLGSSTPTDVNLALYHNDRNGAFTDVTPGSGLDNPLGYAQALAVGDFDGDGYPDIFVAGYGGCHLFRNTGSQSHPKDNVALFEEVTAKAGVEDTEAGPRWGSGAVWFDYDGDGKLDLFLIHYAVWTAAINKKCPRPDGSIGYCVPNVYDGDGVRLFHNEGNGKFRDVTAQAGLSGIHGRGLAVSSLDYNGDGRSDIYIANDLDRNYLLRNNGNGTFTDVGVETGVAFAADGHVGSGMGIGLGDYDHTGRESLFVTNLNGERFSLYHNVGGGQFTYATEQAGLSMATLNHSGWGVAFLDFDRDGMPDLVTANGNVHPDVSSDIPNAGYEEPKGVFRNSGHGDFADYADRSGDLLAPRAGRALAVGDFDNDGRIDLLCVNRNQRADLFRNVSADTGHWLNLMLTGIRSNRDGAGAKVWVTAGKLRTFAECRLGSSYASSSDKRLFFGLGNFNRVDKVEIEWAGGRRDTYAGLEADRFYIATEGKGCKIDGRIGLPKK